MDTDTISVDMIVLLSSCLGLAPREQIEHHIRKLVHSGDLRTFINDHGLQCVQLPTKVRL